MFLAVALLLQASTIAPSLPDKQGQEMVDLFASMCVETAGRSNRAHSFDNQPAFGRPMSVDEMAETAPNRTVSEGWIVKSPAGGQAAIWFAPSKHTCGVTVRAASPNGLESALGSKIKAFYATLGFPVLQRPDGVSIENGVTIHHASWDITPGTHEIAIISSFAEKPVGDHQDLMTFTLLH